jgi:predicted metal-dependent hydrolase
LVRSQKRRKTLSLQIREDGGVVLSVPYHTPKAEIERFILERRSWVIRKIAERERTIRETKRAFVSGEKFLYLGEPYPLEIQDLGHRNPPLKLSSGRFILHQNYVSNARDLFIEWYKREARETIVRRAEDHSNRLHLFPKGIRITNAKSRWGSCSRDNRLSFSWRIILAPLAVVDYILIHELAHIKEKNHSKRFWKFLESILPGYRDQRLWLKRNGYRLGFSFNDIQEGKR